jgi:hypothetical protein
LDGVLSKVRDGHDVPGATAEKGHTKVTWINLREEPLIYGMPTFSLAPPLMFLGVDEMLMKRFLVAGYPYVLRSEALTLRNMKAYS